MKRRVRGLLVTVLFVCSFAGIANAAVVQVGHISMALENSPFYEGATGTDPSSDPGYFHLDNISILSDNGIVLVDGAASYGYGFSGTITVTKSVLTTDNSSGGQVSGDFAGGSVMTINGSFYDLSDPQTSLLTGDILVANMVSTPWLLEEPTAMDVTGNNYFTPVSGGLVSGIDLGNGDILVIGDLRADFSFTTGIGTFMGTDPTEFGTTGHSGLVSNVQITPIPEPCTIILLSLGGIALLRSKRK